MITQRQAEALWCARERGSANELVGINKGSARRVLYSLIGEGYLVGFKITDLGREALAHYEAHHRKPLNPLTKAALMEKMGQRD